MAGVRYSFADFELDAEGFELRRNGHLIRLERKPVELLILFAQSQGRLVTRSEIAGHLWEKEVFVDTEHGINTAVRKVRAALRDDPERPRFLQTVTRAGYRFLPAVTVEQTLPAVPRSAPPNPLPIPTPDAHPAASIPQPPAAALTPASPASRKHWYAALAFLAAVVAAAGWFALHLAALRHDGALPEIRYEQITDLNDSAVSPALSPDGKTVAFFRDDTWFPVTGPLYAQSLIGGEPQLVADDPRPKYGLTFTPDGSALAYSVFAARTFDTYTVPVAGGTPQLFLRNAAGLTWLDSQNLLFSRNDVGVHLGVVKGTASKGATEVVYFPEHQRGMAHLALPSPDKKWILVVEMDQSGHWAPCRLVALQGAHDTRQIGPKAPCTAAAWSRDGRWTYFTARTNGESHLWRQRFPDGTPQQITFGAVEEEGIAVEPSGDSLITSAGTSTHALWLHSSTGEHALTSEGEVLEGQTPPVFRPGNQSIFFLLRRNTSSAGGELRRIDLLTGRETELLPGVIPLEFDISPDAHSVVYTAAAPNGGTALWLASIQGSAPPVNLGVGNARFPRFGAPGEIIFQATDGTANFVEAVHTDGTARHRLLPFSISELFAVSPQGRWAVAMMSETPTVAALPLDGGPPRVLCKGLCRPQWAADDRFLVVPLTAVPGRSPSRSAAIPIGPGEVLPALPADGLRADTPPSTVPGMRWLDLSGIIPGPDLATYAFVKHTTHCNLFRLTLR